MAKNIVNRKDRFISCGGGDRRAVLDYESNLVYQYTDPSNVLAYYESGLGWIIRDQPYYSTGGWGNPATGDGDGYYKISNAASLIKAIGGKLYEVNSMEFLTSAEVKELSQSINSHNAIAKKQNALATRLGKYHTKIEELPQLENYRLKLLNNSKTPKGLDAIKTVLKYDTALETFITGKGKALVVDTYIIKPNAVYQGDITVAFRDAKGDVFLNSMVLKTTKFEQDFLGNQSIIQGKLREIAKYSIPFNVLASAGLDLSETLILEQGPESTHQIKKDTYGSSMVERHFTGALLLENNGRKFLMDIDRLEITHGIFNAFFVEVDKSVKTIVEAYESMKPESVKLAEAEGLDVKRQGEWFFIPTDKTLTVKPDQVLQWDRDEKATKVILRHNIAHGKGRPNTLFKPKGFGKLDELVCGIVSHSGREHKDLDLGVDEIEVNGDVESKTFKLWKVVPNTTVSNFTITGDID